MRVVVALGGYAVLRRGQPMALEGQLEDIWLTCDGLLLSKPRKMN
jgi:carbamate kinase